MIAQATALVEAFDPGDDDLAAKSRELVLMLLKHSEQPFSRTQFAPGHLTATSAVLSPDLSRVALVHHRRLDRWLLPGGHVEPDDLTLEAAARREVLEETGAILGASTGIVGMDVHGIPPRKGEPYHQHHDVLFGFLAASLELVVSDESNEVKWGWISEGEFEVHALAEPIRRAVLRARACFQATSTS